MKLSKNTKVGSILHHAVCYQYKGRCTIEYTEMPALRLEKGFFVFKWPKEHSYRKGRLFKYKPQEELHCDLFTTKLGAVKAQLAFEKNWLKEYPEEEETILIIKRLKREITILRRKNER